MAIKIFKFCLVFIVPSVVALSAADTLNTASTCIREGREGVCKRPSECDDHVRPRRNQNFNLNQPSSPCRARPENPNNIQYVCCLTSKASVERASQREISTPEPARWLEPRPEPRREPQPVHRPEPQPMHRPEPQPMHRPEPQPMHRPEPQPMHRPEPQPMHRPEPQPVHRPQSRPTPQPPPSKTSPNQDESPAGQKCREYAQLVYRTEPSVALAPGNDDVQVDTCVKSGDSLILGGTTASLGEYPHMALIGYGEASNLNYQCGGSLISEDYVLTAAHCTQREMPTFVLLGELDLQNERDGAEPQLIPVQNIYVHPQYNVLSHYYDVALVRLQRRPQLGPRVRPACLHTGATFDSRNLIATGWGATEFGGDFSAQLRKVTLNEVAFDQCDSAYRSSSVGNKLSEGILNQQQVCAGHPGGGKDTCNGDSGGPLQVYRDDPHCSYDIIGVTSFGQGCGGRKTPGVYARVQYFVKWIEDIVWRSVNSAQRATDATSIRNRD